MALYKRKYVQRGTYSPYAKYNRASYARKSYPYGNARPRSNAYSSYRNRYPRRRGRSFGRGTYRSNPSNFKSVGVSQKLQEAEVAVGSTGVSEVLDSPAVYIRVTRVTCPAVVTETEKGESGRALGRALERFGVGFSAFREQMSIESGVIGPLIHRRVVFSTRQNIAQTHYRRSPSSGVATRSPLQPATSEVGRVMGAMLFGMVDPNSWHQADFVCPESTVMEDKLRYHKSESQGGTAFQIRFKNKIPRVVKYEGVDEDVDVDFSSIRRLYAAEESKKTDVYVVDVFRGGLNTLVYGDAGVNQGGMDAEGEYPSPPGTPVPGQSGASMGGPKYHLKSKMQVYYYKPKAVGT